MPGYREKDKDSYFEGCKQALILEQEQLGAQDACDGSKDTSLASKQLVLLAIRVAWTCFTQPADRAKILRGASRVMRNSNPALAAMRKWAEQMVAEAAAAASSAPQVAGAPDTTEDLPSNNSLKQWLTDRVSSTHTLASRTEVKAHHQADFLEQLANRVESLRAQVRAPNRKHRAQQ